MTEAISNPEEARAAIQDYAKGLIDKINVLKAQRKDVEEELRSLRASLTVASGQKRRGGPRKRRNKGTEQEPTSEGANGQGFSLDEPVEVPVE